VRYCGSPLKYSIKDVANENSVTIVDFKGKGDVSFQEVVLEPLRNLRRLRGTLEDITKNAVDTDDYVEVTLTDEEHIMNAMEKVRNLYPNVLRLAFDNSRTQTTEPLSNSANEVEERSMLELFADFFKDAYQQNLYDHPNYLDIVNKAIESVERSVLE
jgi:exonuclease SbcD